MADQQELGKFHEAFIQKRETHEQYSGNGEKSFAFYTIDLPPIWRSYIDVINETERAFTAAGKSILGQIAVNLGNIQHLKDQINVAVGDAPFTVRVERQDGVMDITLKLCRDDPKLPFISKSYFYSYKQMTHPRWLKWEDGPITLRVRENPNVPGSFCDNSNNEIIRGHKLLIAIVYRKGVPSSVKQQHNQF